MPETKERLDVIVVQRGWAESREKAQRLIRAGQIRKGTDVLDKPGVKVNGDDELTFSGLRDRFVSRGGWKLEAAFAAFPELTPCPPCCVDIGASTGGFTDCLLQHGAQKVYAIDVGQGQLDQKLREDERVMVMEKVNARHLKKGDLHDLAGLVVSDVSFISLAHILGPARALAHPDSQMVALVKPQFEAGRDQVGRGGVVRNPETHVKVLQRVVHIFLPRYEWHPWGLVPSPVRGPAGNWEYLLHLKTVPGKNRPVIDVDSVVQEVFQKV